MKQNETKKEQKEQNEQLKFSCDYCLFYSCKKNNYDRHILTDKHKIKTNETNETKMKQKRAKKSSNIFECLCGVKFNSRSTLWRHTKICTIKNNKNNINGIINDTINDSTINISDYNVMIQILQQNEEFKKMIIEQNKLIIEQNNKLVDNCNETKINISNNNNKTFNLNVFLNETCKDAMNIMDFVDSLNLQLSDLENVGKIGFVEGITNIIVKNLKTLDITQRPIHCSDSKREIMYVKDEDQWYNDTKETENKKIIKAIKHIAHKNSKNISLFKEKYPDCVYSDSKKSDVYNKIIIEALGGSGNEDIDSQNKIIKKIAKEVSIDKQNF